VRRDVCLLLSGRCNLRCDYCYQDDRRCSAAMDWSVARAAIDRGLRLRPDVLGVVLSGGEPLLVPGLVRRCIEHVRSVGSSSTRVELTLSTNGTLLTPEIVDLLAGFDVTLHLSLDGVAEAQERRGSDVGVSLDALLDGLRRSHGRFMRERVVANMVALPATLPHLGRSLRLVIDSGVRTIRIGPRLTPDPDWLPGSHAVLAAAMDDVLELSFAHWLATGETPVEFLRPEGRLRSARPARRTGCRAATGTAFCVDPDGRSWPCAMFVSSMQRQTQRAEEVSRALALGDVRHPRFLDRLAGLPVAASRLAVFADSPSRHSQLGRCSECELREDCQICPFVLCAASDDQDPCRVPDFACAFTRAALHARERFLLGVGGGSAEHGMLRMNMWVRELEALVHGLASC